jgi:hypothetical protein
MPWSIARGACGETPRRPERNIEKLKLVNSARAPGPSPVIHPDQAGARVGPREKQQSRPRMRRPLATDGLTECGRAIGRPGGQVMLKFPSNIDRE